jgi:hypothetical protein
MFAIICLSLLKHHKIRVNMSSLDMEIGTGTGGDGIRGREKGKKM